MKCPKCKTDNPESSRFCGSCATPLRSDQQQSFEATKTLETPIQALSNRTLIAGRYRVIEEVGRGGMGIVYKAEDTKLRRTVALKFLPHQWTSDVAARERFIHEARAASALDHPNICNIHEIEETEAGRMYISMAFYEGESLRDKIKREPLRVDEALSIAIQVALGMAKAHEKGIVHRDIKPANIRITNDGVTKIVDFGLAKLAGQVKLTREGTTVGTVAYMSPEQARGDAVDARTDIWSLGVVVFEMLSGHLPFKGDYEQSLIHSILKTEPEPITKFRKDLPKGLEPVILRALSKNPASRYQTMNELLEDLNALAEGLRPIRARVSLFRGRVLGVKKIYAFVGLAVVVILAALALLFLFPKHGTVYDSLAVLPFENRSQDPTQDALADELTERLIFKFHTVGSLRVPMFSSVADYRNAKKPCREIGRDQNVKAVLYSSFQRKGNDLRIWVTLMDASTELPLWTHEYPRDLTDFDALESELAQSIVGQVRVILTPDEKNRMASSQKVDARALDAYLEAKNEYNVFSSNPTFERWKAIIATIQKAIDIDPNYAQLYWSLADIWLKGQGNNFISSKVAIEGAEAALEKGRVLDRNSSAMYIAAGNLDLLKWDWDGCKNEWKRAVELAPGDPAAHYWYAGGLQILGYFDEAISEAKLAIKLDPSNNISRLNLGSIYFFSRRYDEAIDILSEGLQLNPKDAYLHDYLAQVYALKGIPAEAIAEANKCLALIPSSEMGFHHRNVALVYAISGRREEALKLLDEYLISRKGKPIDAYAVAGIYAALNNKDEAFKWLEKTYQGRLVTMCQFKTDPFMDNLRSDPRYKEYLKKAGFEK